MLDAHPAIGESKKLSKHSAAEQGADYDPAVIAELMELNAQYEESFGFRFVVFVNRRPKHELIPILRERLERTREQELDTGVDELIAIAAGPLAAGVSYRAAERAGRFRSAVRAQPT